ncbi:SRPBCC family protein [Marinobacter arenosus]|uniref:SRPBCC family protein n=1 Tax=Marinobacter arenosus TaxID=2856822 RepID=UPI001C4CCB5D|nr:SRPBCC family protein [Marinobacter arenosus]MBW0149560.1 SRPBCC family protein [Marinobacter arenosus]
METDIDVASGVVWRILSDFESWDDWHGPGLKIRKEGERPKQLIFRIGPLPVAINLSKVKIVTGKSIEWRGALPFSGALLFGERRLAVEPTSKGTCKLIQRESFFGLLSPLLRSRLSKLYQNNYSLFNENIKALAESQSNKLL